MKVGDYVKIKNNKICKIIDKKFDDTLLIDLYKTDIKCYLMEIDIIKSSPNIIDLIEVGDILTFKDGSICKIIEITDNGYYLLKDYGGEQYYESKEWLKDIKSIVTKEQFEKMEYKI